ncbi:hypothetical protein LTR85_006146 [Meristemomyces frigidus]|nr:hypothetical protein LTR85_006146 [Meristemomyces frigidus]
MSAMDSQITGIVKPKGAFTIALAIGVLAALYYLGQAIYNAFFGPLSKIPGPPLRALTKIPQITTMMTGRDNTVYPALHEKYGPVVRIAPNDLSLANGAQSFQEIYGFRKHGQAKPFKDPAFYGKAMNGAPGIIIADDAGHSRQRKILSHAFSDKALKDQEPLLKTWTEKLKTKLMERAGQKTDMLKYYNCTTFDIMGDLTFGEGLNMLEDSEYSPWVKTIFGSIKNATMFRGIRVYSALTKYLVDEIIFKSKAVRRMAHEHFKYSAERVDRRLKRNPERPDLWSKVLEKSDGPDGLSLGEHHSNASTFMVAGTETTATALSGTTYHLLRTPHAMEKLNTEIRSAFSSFDNLTLETLAHQKYLMAVLQEGLRMYPPVPVSLPRCVPKGGMAVNGQWVPEGTVVGVHHMSVYRSKTHFKLPNEFHPERWLGDPEFKDDHLDALEVFSHGPRNCLGKNLAWHEMRLLLATIVLHFDLQLCEESLDWTDQRVYTLWEKKPLWCTLTPPEA